MTPFFILLYATTALCQNKQNCVVPPTALSGIQHHSGAAAFIEHENLWDFTCNSISYRVICFDGVFSLSSNHSHRVNMNTVCISGKPYNKLLIIL